MTSHVFTYGSLMFPEVWRLVVQGSYRSQPASVPGFSRHALHGRDYPGMVARPGASVAGILYFDLSPADLARLDAFEGEEYRRIEVAMAPDGKGPALRAGTYLYQGPDLLAQQEWDPDAFVAARFLLAHAPAATPG
ncbi:MAG: gamma-glutamylcyclotransferase [Paucimonas sp.]|nr:gamma-glutamylcyclotransferase [Paucimonas sp.]